MSDLRPFPNTPRAIIDYNFISTMFGEQVFICVPKSAYQIARDFLVASGFYVGSYYTSVDDSGYYTPTVEQFNNIDSAISDFLAAEVYDMGCFEDLVLSINCLCEAIYNTSCSGGSGGSGLYPQVASEFVDNGVDFPSGYTDRAAYDTGKCDLAQWLIDNWALQFNKLQEINVAAAGAGALAGILQVVVFLPIPGAILFQIAVTILGLAAGGIAAFTNALNELEARISAMDI